MESLVQPGLGTRGFTRRHSLIHHPQPPLNRQPPPTTNRQQGVVRRVDPDALTLTDGTVIPFGLCIWSTGVGPTAFTLSLPFAKTQVGRLAVDDRLRVLAPPRQDEPGGGVRHEAEAVEGPGKVGLVTLFCAWCVDRVELL